MTSPFSRLRLVPFVLLALAFAPVSAFAAETITLWHSYRGAEEDALIQVLERFHASQSEIRVESLAIPNDVLASKLTTALPRGHGPDVFVFAHERIGGWAKAGMLRPLDRDLAPGQRESFLAETVEPLRFEGKLWGLPLSFKSLALFYNKALVPTPPATSDEMVAMARTLSGGDRFGLAWETGNFYCHAPWFFGFGATIFHEDGRLAFDTKAAIDSFAFVGGLRADGLVPEEVSGALVSSLFNQGNAGMVISGPWFTGEISGDVDFGVAPLPLVSATGKPATPFLTDEGVMVSALAKSPGAAFRVASFLAGEESARLRATVGRQAVASRAAWEDPVLANDPVLAAFRAQLATTIPMDNRPQMRNVWEPAQLSLRKVLRGDATAEGAALAGLRRFAAITRPAPPLAAPGPYIALGLAAALGLLAILVRSVTRTVRSGRAKEAAAGWTWVAPAALATGILILVPFAVGLTLSLFDHREGTWTFVGLANFADIIATRSFGPMEPLSFYYALLVTVLWTACNLALHVGFGLALALLLNRPMLKLKGIYRVLLIVPWAVPNYITALLWKGLFHKQFGAINGLLESLGIEGVAWFSSFWTAFFANVCTNAWLGFPFMMVVCLGALQSIPRDLYEAADVDGAGRWQKFRHVTLPLLLPALVPAVLLGTVWTFNQFNIVYLVSGGEPDNSTDILISEAYRWAFARQDQYGYAAAYAALIFALLLGWSAISSRIARSAEALRA